MKLTGKAYVFGKTEKLSAISEILNNSINSKEIEKTLQVDFEECYDDKNEWEVEYLSEAENGKSWMIVNYYGEYFWGQLSEIFGGQERDEEDPDIDIVDYVDYKNFSTNDAYAINVTDRYFIEGDDEGSYFYETLAEVIARLKKKYSVPDELSEKWDIIRWLMVEKDMALNIGELKVEYHLFSPWTRDSWNVISLK